MKRTLDHFFKPQEKKSNIYVKDVSKRINDILKFINDECSILINPSLRI